MGTRVVLSVCLILVDISFGDFSGLPETQEVADIAHLTADTVIRDSSTEFSNNITNKIKVESETKPTVSNDDGPNVVTNVMSSNQRPPINTKGYFPSIGANLDDKHLIFIEFLNKLSQSWMRPFQEKIQKVAEFLTHPNHPGLSLGAFNNFNPQNFFDRLHEKSHQLLTGSKVSIYGTRPIANYDYPFAYRNHRIDS